MQSRTITIAPAEGTWVVRAGGAVIGESSNALELHEDGKDPVIYFPREDIEMAFLDDSDRIVDCPNKGRANFYSIVAKSGEIPDSVWSYENPKEEVARIRRYLAFDRGDRITIEQI